MKFIKGTTIKSIDGDDVGNLDDIIVDPTDNKVTHIVVKKGFFFTEDRVVPIEALRGVDEDIVLDVPEDDFDIFPHFEEQRYIRPKRNYPPETVGESDWGHWETPVRPLFYYGLPHTGLYPGELDPRQPERMQQTERNIPEDTVVISEGTEVYSVDDEHAGNVDGVIIDESGNISHLVISKGFLFTTERLIPVNWVRHVSDSRIQLLVDTAIIEDLPEYSQQD